MNHWLLKNVTRKNWSEKRRLLTQIVRTPKKIQVADMETDVDKRRTGLSAKLWKTLSESSPSFQIALSGVCPVSVRCLSVSGMFRTHVFEVCPLSEFCPDFKEKAVRPLPFRIFLSWFCLLSRFCPANWDKRSPLSVHPAGQWGGKAVRTFGVLVRRCLLKNVTPQFFEN